MDTSGSSTRRASRAPHSQITDLKPELERLARRLRERLPASGEASRDFFISSLERLGRLRTSGHHEIRLRCLGDIFKFFYSLGDTFKTLQASRLLAELAERSESRPWMRKAKSYEGIARADVGDIHSAVIAYVAALRMAQELTDVRAEMSVLGNLGIALFYAGFHGEAMRCYERSFDLAAAIDDDVCGSLAASNMAQACLHVGDLTLGIQHVKRALELDQKGSAPQTLLNRTILEFVYVQLALGIGDRKLADQRLHKCEQFAAAADTPRARFMARMARGACEIDHGDSAKGLDTLRTALAGTTGFNHERINCLMMLIRGLERTGNVEEALFHVDELCAGLAKLFEAGVRAIGRFAGDYPITTLRSGQLDVWSSHRLRLGTIAAQRTALQAQFELIERLATAAHLKDDATGLHGLRVGKLSQLFAEHLKMRADAVLAIRAAGRLHDIGKIAIPDSVLRGPAKLTAAERELLKAHASIGAGLLAHSNVPELRCAEMVARHHHERWDGEGYPSRMKGKRIPVECRIVALADAFDAMTHGRPHVSPVSNSVALGEIEIQKGRQFDPELADRFIGFVRALLSERPDLSHHLEESGNSPSFSDSLRELEDLIAAVPAPQSHAGLREAVARSREPGRPSTRLREPL